MTRFIHITFSPDAGKTISVRDIQTIIEDYHLDGATDVSATRTTGYSSEMVAPIDSVMTNHGLIMTDSGDPDAGVTFNAITHVHLYIRNDGRASLYFEAP